MPMMKNGPIQRKVLDLSIILDGFNEFDSMEKQKQDTNDELNEPNEIMNLCGIHGEHS